MLHTAPPGYAAIRPCPRGAVGTALRLGLFAVGSRLDVHTGNSSGNDGRQGRLIKALGNLQDLRQRIYRKGKAEAIGWGGVDAG